MTTILPAPALESGGGRKRLPHKNADLCAPPWDRRCCLSTRRSRRFFPSFLRSRLCLAPNVLRHALRRFHRDIVRAILKRHVAPAPKVRRQIRSRGRCAEIEHARLARLARANHRDRLLNASDFRINAGLRNLRLAIDGRFDIRRTRQREFAAAGQNSELAVVAQHMDETTEDQSVSGRDGDCGAGPGDRWWRRRRYRARHASDDGLIGLPGPLLEDCSVHSARTCNWDPSRRYRCGTPQSSPSETPRGSSASLCRWPPIPFRAGTSL